MEFLKAPRFWMMIFGAVTVYLQQKGYIGEAEMLLAATIASGFIGIRTIDRFGEKLSPLPDDEWR